MTKNDKNLLFIYYKRHIHDKHEAKTNIKNIK